MAHANTTTQFSTFYVGGLHFGIEVKEVQEVLKYQDMTPVPLSSPVISGLINLRGQLITAVDMRRRLGLEQRKDGNLPMNVVLQTKEGAISLLVDQIGDVIDVAEEVMESAPDTLTGGCREVVQKVCKLEDSLLLILDSEKTLMV
jgi:purine-binding chemotaxis protein CheW